MGLDSQLYNSDDYGYSTPSENIENAFVNDYKSFADTENGYSNTLQALELSLASEEELPAAASWMDISELATKLTEIPISLSPSMLNIDTISNEDNKIDDNVLHNQKIFNEFPIGLPNGLVVPKCTASYIDLQNCNKNKALVETNTTESVDENVICNNDSSLSMTLEDAYTGESKSIDLHSAYENQQSIIDDIQNIDDFTNVDYDDMFNELFTNSLDNNLHQKPKPVLNSKKCKCNCDNTCCESKSNNNLCKGLVQTFQDITRDICKCIDCKCDPSQECWESIKEYYSSEINENDVASKDYINVQKDENFCRNNVNEFDNKCCVVICLKNVEGLKELLFNC